MDIDLVKSIKDYHKATQKQQLQIVLMINANQWITHFRVYLVKEFIEKSWKCHILTSLPCSGTTRKTKVIVIVNAK